MKHSIISKVVYTPTKIKGETTINIVGDTIESIGSKMLMDII